MFIDWVAGFGKWNYIKDSWGLFNPPGVNAHDKDPDDDIHFDPKDFFDIIETTIYKRKEMKHFKVPSLF
ncbi:hypothetical protein [Flavobacterium flavigenum]|uniref:hypothetical protein n=1 Tax=Flavobacterium flavigenum TaxID=3003258 RepID=UPI0022AC2770|nr:hypothetical protein [Flavobacterium flavigenum]